MRSDLRSLLASIGNETIPTGDYTDVTAHTRLAAAASSLAVAHNRAVVSAKDITASEYLSRASEEGVKATDPDLERMNALR